MSVLAWTDGSARCFDRGSLRTSSDATVRLGTLASDTERLPVASWPEQLVVDGATTYGYHLRRRETTGWTEPAIRFRHGGRGAAPRAPRAGSPRRG